MKFFALLALMGMASAANDKVKIDLYYESECPACKTMITSSFDVAFKADGFLNMAEVNLMPYGNAHESKDGDSWDFTCQHGEVECQYNLVEACAVNLIKCPYMKYEFLNCVENKDGASKDYEGVAKECATQGKLKNGDDIVSCYNGPDAIKYEHAIALQTAALSPPHKYVPWVVADGVHSDDINDAVYDSLLKYVCTNYKGTKKSKDCAQFDGVQVTPSVKYEKCYRFEDMAPVEAFLQ